MSRLLYPRLPNHFAQELAKSFEDKNVKELSEHHNSSHNEASPSSVGGIPVNESVLVELREKVLSEVKSMGFPETANNLAKQDFDYKIGKLLHKNLNICIGEASRNEVWSFIGCVLMPDIVSWRFPSNQKDRFLGGGRNTFQRLWWRANALYDKSDNDPYNFLKLPEDALVQIMERPNMMSNWELGRAIAKETEKIIQNQNLPTPKDKFWRDACKRIGQRGPIFSYISKSSEELRILAEKCFMESLNSIPSYFYYKGDLKKQFGPFSLAEFKKAIAELEPSKTYFAYKGMKDWKPLNEFNDLS